MTILHVFTLATTAETFFDMQFKYLVDSGYEISVVAGSEASSEFLATNNIEFIRLDIARRVDIIADIKSILSLWRLMTHKKFDAVVGHTPKGALVSMCAARLAGVKTRIYYRHGLIYTTATGLKRLIYKSVEQLTAALATNIINVSPSLSKLAVVDHLNSNKKQAVIGYGTCGGIDTENLFNPALLSEQKQDELRRSIVGECDFVVGFCGRLCKDKGISELINGFKLFLTKHPLIKSKLLLVGGYDTRDILPESIKNEIAINPNILSIGRQEKNLLPYLYSMMDVFVFPSYREGFGMCVIEASAMRVPVLVSRSHGCIDSIKENISGRYIDVSAESIADGVSIMLDSILRRELGTGGRKFVVDNFEQKKLWPIIKKYYDDCILSKK